MLAGEGEEESGSTHARRYPQQGPSCHMPLPSPQMCRRLWCSAHSVLLCPTLTQVTPAARRAAYMAASASAVTELVASSSTANTGLQVHVCGAQEE